MAIAERLKQFLERRGLQPDFMRHDPSESLEAAVVSAGVDPREVLQATLLIDATGALMAVHGFRSVVDMGAVSRLTSRSFRMLPSRQADRLFPDCSSGCHPPVGSAWGLPVVVDQRVWSMDTVILSSGRDNCLLRLDGEDLGLILEEARTGRIALQDDAADIEPDGAGEITLDEVAERLQKLYRLPPMPALALRILRLTRDPEASANDLSNLIEYDPSLTAQIMRYARSALFQYPGEVHSVQEAVTRVLGFDRVAHMAMGIASARAFDVPRDGMLGMDAFWRHSIYCAFLCQQMARRLNLDRGLAYLCGLLHNFGLLLTGHLFPDQFDQLNRLRESNPEQSMRALEERVFGVGDDVLGVGHGAIGGILHRLWQLPDAVVKAAGVHQQPDYEGDYADYVRMVQLANEWLKEKGIGDEFNVVDWQPVADRLGLDATDAERLLEETGAVAEELDALARQLAA
ncbi:histidine kinase [Tamilnaduibacter salinus]|uniref:Histidine kinase n=1 Tax=Tamilnaduibacter salinus TaxID=1484056 RepID=A0A2A2I582_9GAMM|nr:HDOD domain-containing protein [Tamilnaduibacter salinus]PAV27171.1 histidine kinase [Tamilnaduibacter salinus]